MPRDTPFTKFLRTERLGAHVVQVGANLSEAWQTAMDVAEKENLTFVHPYDDPRIVAGQGTIGLELAEDCPDLDAVIVPVGGGGLISGIAIAMKALIPEIEVVGAEAARFALMSAATGLAPQISGRDTVADGIAVAEVGSIAKDVVKRLVSDMLRVDEDDIETAMQILVSEQNIVAEGAGAVPLAAVLDEPNRFRGRKVALIVSGGNVDSRLLASILMRSLVRQGRLTRLRVETSDAPGELSDVSEIIGRTGGNIVEVEHQRLFYDVPVKSAEIDFVIETRDTEHVAEIVAALEGAGFPTQLLSNKGHDEKN
jgi:threonine dehydratase